MFYHARIRLTAWYLVILMCISILFSVIIYHITCQQIFTLIQNQQQRIAHLQADRFDRFPNHVPSVLTIQDYHAAETRLLHNLLIMNLGILLLAGGLGYILAGITLRPIKEMIEEQSQFISNASHELRTPLATLRAQMEGGLLEKHISDAKARDIIQSNLEEVDTLQSLSDTLLRLAQLHSIHSVATEHVSIAEVLAVACKKVQPMSVKKQITIHTSDRKVYIVGVKSELVALFVILLDNAVKYSQKNKTVTIAVELVDHRVKIKVTDQGHGIPEEDVPFIFHRFFRGDKSRSESEGYGLGLSIAQKIVISHNGTISVKSIVGTGSIFTLTFPTVSPS